MQKFNSPIINDKILHVKYKFYPYKYSNTSLGQVECSFTLATNEMHRKRPFNKFDQSQRTIEIVRICNPDTI